MINVASVVVVVVRVVVVARVVANVVVAKGFLVAFAAVALLIMQLCRCAAVTGAVAGSVSYSRAECGCQKLAATSFFTKVHYIHIFFYCSRAQK